MIFQPEDKDKEKISTSTSRKDKNAMTDQEKLELHRAKRRAQAAARRERSRREKELAEARAKEAAAQKASGSKSRAASADAELAMLVDDATAGAARASSGEALDEQSREMSVPAAPSVGDIPAYLAGMSHDNSEYNTDYDEIPGEGEGDQSHRGDSEMGIDEELAQLA